MKRKLVILENIIIFQDALLKLYEVEKEGSLRFNFFRDSYKSQIEDLKEQLKNKL